MPANILHLGPGLLLGQIFTKRINLIAILLASILVDIRGAYCFLNNCVSDHGIFHTLLVGSLLALFLAGLIWNLKKPLQKFTKALRINNNYSFSSIILGTLLGAWSHVLLDSFLYSDIRPFWPIESNFLLGLLNRQTIDFILLTTIVIGIIIYIYKFKKYEK